MDSNDEMNPAASAALATGQIDVTPRAHGSLHGRRAAVTGGTAGLGLALVRELRSRGAHVAFVARGRPAVEHTVRDVAGHTASSATSRRRRTSTRWLSRSWERWVAWIS